MTFPDSIGQQEQDDDPQKAKDVLENLWDSSADSIGVADTKGRIIKWNAASEEIFGYSMADLKGMHFSELYEDPGELEKMLARLRRDGFIRKYEINMKKKDGTVAPFNLSINLLYDRQHKVTGSLCIARDRSDTRRALNDLQTLNKRLEKEIIERKKMEGALCETRETLRALINAIPESIFLIDAGGVIFAANATLAKRLGKGLDELIGTKVSELLPAELVERSRTYLAEAIRTGRMVHFEDMRDGRFLDISISPIMNGGGKVSKLAVFSLDITERKRAEETLRKSEQRYRLLVNQIPAVLFKGYADGSIDFFDRKVEDLTGYPKEDFDSRTLKWTDLVVREDQKDWKNKFLEALRTNRSFMREYRIRRKDGTLRWLEGRAQILCDEAGRIGYVSGVLFDITEQRRTEEALRESEEKYRGLIETTSTGYVIVDAADKVLDANPEYVRLTGHHDLKEILGRSVIDWTAEQDRWKNAAAQEQCQKTGVIKHLELTYVGGDGRSLPVEINATAIRTSEGVKRIALVRDISDRKRIENERAKLEAQLVQAQKMEAIGTLAGGIAHDFNNILTAILGNIGLGMLDQDMGDQGRQRLAAAEKACQQAQRLARQLLTFAKGGAPIKELVSLENLVAETASLACRGSQVRCEYAFGKDLMAIFGDPGQICQVFQNLIINAIQAMPQGGTIEITGENIKVGKDGRLPLQAGNYVKVSIKDQGIGIPEKNLQKIFDPYFTTKQQGSGLGLATAYSVVKNHHGHISAESGLAEGSTFQVYLPASNGKVKRPPQESTELLSGKGKILVMDDEAMVREVLGMMLLALGYEAQFAKDGVEAIALFSQAQGSADPFTAIILDLTVPGGMGGKEAMERLLKIDPQVKAIVSSGYFDDPIMADFQKYGFAGVIAKPYKVAELGKTLNKVLTKGD
ncbi:MAG: PAS domain S-box protein [Desulfobaccales bacterium]